MIRHIFIAAVKKGVSEEIIREIANVRAKISAGMRIILT